MRRLPFYTSLVAAILFPCQVFPTSTLYCEFDNNNCIDGLAQSTSSFRLQNISIPLSFVYSFDAGRSPQDGKSSIKVGYWLQYDSDVIRNQLHDSPSINRTTEFGLRLLNIRGWIGGHHHGCKAVWGPQCSQSLKSYLQQSIYNLSTSKLPYESALETVLKSFIDNPDMSIEGCPSKMFLAVDIPTTPFINETSSIGKPNNIQIADPGNPFCPSRTTYLPNTTPDQQAMQIVLGIAARSPTYGSESLHGPQDVDVDLVCTKAPKHIPNEVWPGGPGGDDGHDDHDGQYANPSMPAYNPFLGNRATVVDAFDFDSDYDFDDDEEADEDCPSSEI
ncbi:hypothetical protein BGW36DRAFT_423141 [Talaromyces proteolyticus]|uniref:Uncharacterized protein n=1 Tax=Talaromyces proteolyticus TaxID=1131652 RepID=A0AAD4KXW5_9EURO|nr:uncharacterized protein BGW36DRAFT_423141 [Talaromyces proteolyticus]KAH8703585.1 hypothetical protein BGW36DRAFT_423141 [Talaromyces proteolyticus]